MVRLLVVTSVLFATLANARAETAQPDWKDAPPADEASGIEQPERTPVSERLLVVPRALLFVPRTVLWDAAQPIRGAAYAWERYDVPGRFNRVFFTEDGTFGVYPTLGYESGFGVTAGARLIHRNVFGAGERLKLRASVGNELRQAYGINIRSGRRIPRVAFELDSSFERRPNEPFYGIGDAVAPVEMRFHEDVVRNAGRADIALGGAFELRLASAVMDRTIETAATVHNVRFESELVYDSRRPTSIYASRAIDATGWFASMHAGLTRGLGGDASSFTSYGGELQRYFDLYRGTRVLALRVLAEGVSDGAMSFIDMPRLGGSEYLRGYPTGRFRDRALTLATVEYTWDLGNFLAAYTFVDAGRVWPSLRDIALVEPRVGYGIGIQVHTTWSYIGRGQVAASRDGDVVVELVLSPAFPRRERIGRY